MDASTDINLLSNGGVINLTTPPSGKTYINYSNPNIGDGELVCAQISYQNDINISPNANLYLNATTGGANITSFGATNILSLDSNISINSNVSSINLLAPTSEIIMTTTQATLTDGTGSTSSIAPTLIKVGTQTNGDDLGSISLIGINSTASQSINFSPSNGTDLIQNGYINWYNRPMSITFLHKWQGSFQYPNPFGSTNVWNISQIETTSFPSQFLHSTWAVSFSINFNSQGSDPLDTGFACYIDFIDSVNNVFTGFTFNQTTPYAQYYNTSTYTATSKNPMIITMTDYFDFTGAVNKLDIRLNYYADNGISQNYTITSAFTLMSLI